MSYFHTKITGVYKIENDLVWILALLPTSRLYPTENTKR